MTLPRSRGSWVWRAEGRRERRYAVRGCREVYAAALVQRGRSPSGGLETHRYNNLLSAFADGTWRA
jgi:hypothetical protein